MFCTVRDATMGDVMYGAIGAMSKTNYVCAPPPTLLPPTVPSTTPTSNISQPNVIIKVHHLKALSICTLTSA